LGAGWSTAQSAQYEYPPTWKLDCKKHGSAMRPKNTEPRTRSEIRVRPQDAGPELSVSDFAPRNRSFRENALFSIKLFAIVAGLLGLLWFVNQLAR